MKLETTSYISPKVKKGLPSSIHGRGLFATELLTKNEVVAKKNGYELSCAQLQKTNPKGHIELQIADDSFLAPVDEGDFEKNMIFINHSCNPNVGMKGDREFVAMRPISAGEELTIDYAMIDNVDYAMVCTCGSSNCRKKITGRDWMMHELHHRYKNYFSPYLKEKVEKLHCEINHS